MNTSPQHPQKDKLAERVLQRIASENPRPRWEFIFKNYFFWGFGAVAVIFGSFAFAAILFEIENIDWRLAPATHGDLLTFFFAAAPFLWIGMLVAFILLGYITVRRTTHGYRYPLTIIAIGAVLTSITLGSALYATGLGGPIEGAPGTHLPFYRPIVVEEHSWWLAPERGLLGGKVVSVTPLTTSFTLRDFNGNLWNIDSSDLRSFDQVAIARGGEVRVVGVPMTATSSTFHACFVFPWESHGNFRKAIPPPPLAVIASTSNVQINIARSEACQNIRPYQQLRDLDNDAF
jgi:hypothetical protein